MAISVMPPGEVPSSSVTHGSPVAHASTAANAAQIPIKPNVPTATDASQRGAVCRNSARKRTPRLTPITSCAALTTAWGTADRCNPAMVTAMDTSIAPMNHGLARPRRSITKAPAPVSKASSARPGQLTSRTVGVKMSSPCRPLHCRANGMVIVTMSRRRLWLAATRSVRAFSRSESRVISDAAPIAPAK